MNLKRIAKTALLLLLVLIVIAQALYFFQDKLIFQAVKLSRNHTFSFGQPYEEHFIAAQDGIEINALWFKPSQQAKGLVIYFHGNAGNLQRWGNYAVDITNLGYEVLMIDYRGYGKSSGAPSEKILYEDAKRVWDWVRQRTEHKKIVIYGRSLGSAVATHLAADVQPGLLILETPFDELKGGTWLRYLLSAFPLRSRFPTKDYLGKVACKIVIFHGTDDWVVNLKSAERLKPLLKESDEFVIIPEGGHRNLRDFALYHTKLAAALQ
jgi:uncharacterized protein